MSQPGSSVEAVRRAGAAQRALPHVGMSPTGVFARSFAAALVLLTYSASVLGQPSASTPRSVAAHDAGAPGPRASVEPAVASFVQKALLSASDNSSGADLGASIAVSGDTVVVGADAATTTAGASGVVYVFVRAGSGWADATQVAKLTASDKADGDKFGSSVSISGSTIVVGAPGDDIGATNDRGSVYVFTKPAGGWVSGTQTAKLTASDGTTNDHLGVSVAVDGTTIVAGAYYDSTGTTSDHGSGYVFVKPAGGWATGTQTAKLRASDADTNWQVGKSAAISGNTIALGAHGATVGTTIHAGALYVYVKPAGGWADAAQTARLTPASPVENEFMGWSIALSGDTVVGGEINIANVPGAAHVYVKPAGGWADAHEDALLTASDGVALDYFAVSVAISGSTILAGRSVAAAAYVFLKPAGGWSNGHENQKLTPTPPADSFGTSVAASGDVLAIGAPGADLTAASSNDGAGFVFVRPSSTVRKPDGRIRLGTAGALAGDNVYNSTGAAQSKSGSAGANGTVTFQVSVQNDGTAADTFKVKASGTASSKFTVKYLQGTTDITSAVVAGTYSTSSLAPGAALTLTVKVTVKTSAAAGNSVTRLVTLTSVGDSTQKDAVQVVAKRN